MANNAPPKHKPPSSVKDRRSFDNLTESKQKRVQKKHANGAQQAVDTDAEHNRQKRRDRNSREQKREEKTRQDKKETDAAAAARAAQTQAEKAFRTIYRTAVNECTPTKTELANKIAGNDDATEDSKARLLHTLNDVVKTHRK